MRQNLVQKPLSFISIVLYFFISLLHASEKLETVTLQLQWKDQFEFAGFYAAKEKGFYRDVGLEVNFKPFDPTKNIIDEVLDGKAEYGLVYSTLISRYLKGDPVVFVANFFKYSPLMIVSQEQYTLPSDLKGKMIMGVSSELSSETIMMMFKKFNTKSSELNIVTPTFKIEDFLDKKVDAMTVYSTNEIYDLVRSKAKFNVLNPSVYGVPSYDLNLFTTQNELKNHPERVAKFRAASIKGWEYALDHKDEIIQLIKEKYNEQNKTYEALKYEAKQIHDIMLPSLKPIGSIDPQKVVQIAENFVELKIVPPMKKINLDKFIYHVAPQNLQLTDLEKEYLQKKQKITYCADPMWMPISQIKGQKHIGIDADILALLSKKLKRDFKLVKTKEWEESIKLAREGKCDILTFVAQTPKREAYHNFTQYIMQTPLVLATTIDKRFVNDIRELTEAPIGIVRDYAYKELLTSRYPFLNLVEVANVKEGLKKVANNELYGMIDNLSVLSYAIENHHLGAIKVSARVDMKIDYAYGVNKDDTLLLSILNKAIGTIDEGEKHAVIKRWTNPSFEEEKRYFELSMKILGVLLLILLALLYHYRKIRKDNINLEYISSKDALSKLYNRRYMDEHIKNILDHKKYKHFSLILVDIDNFKNINDTYGHPYGDIVIIKVAAILNDNVRSEDIVSRWGGEEFLIFCPNATQEDAQKLAERLRMTIEDGLKKEDGEAVTSSFGVAEYTTSHADHATYLQKVDQALYTAKRSGKNRVEVY